MQIETAVFHVPNIGNKKFQLFLGRRGACSEARLYVGNQDLAESIRNLIRLDWLDWLVQEARGEFGFPLCVDYEAKRALLYVDYEAKRALLYADYDAKRALLYADYEAKRAPLCVDYDAKRALLCVDYEAKRALLYADYEAKRALLYADLLSAVKSLFVIE